MRWLRSCVYCSYFVPPVDGFCESCWELFEVERNRSVDLKRSGYPFPVYSLLTWTDDREPLVRAVVDVQKMGRAPYFSRLLAQIFTVERVALNPQPLHGLFIHPPSQQNKWDHSAVLRENFLHFWKGFRRADCLERNSNVISHQQKDLSSFERSKLRFSLSQTPLPRNKGRIVFVDDIITTGSTAMAAYLAMGEPKDFEVWTLVHRPKLATLPRV